MNRSTHDSASPVSIRGQLLRLSEHRAVAIYLRGDRTWVADFVDGHGVLVDVDTWFRFNCGTVANSHVTRRIALESAIPLSSQLIARIEALHRELEQSPCLTLPGALAIAGSTDVSTRDRRTLVKSTERKQPATTMSRFGAILKIGVCLGVLGLLVVVGRSERTIPDAQETRITAAPPAPVTRSPSAAEHRKQVFDERRARFDAAASTAAERVAAAMKAEDDAGSTCSGGADGGMDASGNQCGRGSTPAPE